jgi:hypothetical protein
MLPYDSEHILSLFNRLTGRPMPPAADAVTDIMKYQWLTEAQNEVVSEIAAVAPQALYQRGAPGEMQTTDRKIFTFGTVTVDEVERPVVPFGKVQLYRNLSDVPDRPLREGIDYISEVSQIRIPGNRTLSGTIYWRGIVMPDPITAEVAPALIPPEANELTAIRAARNFAESGNLRNPALADRMEKRWKQRWPHLCLLFKRQFQSGGALRYPAFAMAAFAAQTSRTSD